MRIWGEVVGEAKEHGRKRKRLKKVRPPAPGLSSGARLVESRPPSIQQCHDRPGPAVVACFASSESPLRGDHMGVGWADFLSLGKVRKAPLLAGPVK